MLRDVPHFLLSRVIGARDSGFASSSASDGIVATDIRTTDTEYSHQNLYHQYFFCVTQVSCTLLPHSSGCLYVCVRMRERFPDRRP